MMVPTHKYISFKSLYSLYFPLITTVRILIISYSDGNLEIAIYNTDFKEWLEKSCFLIFPCSFLARISGQNMSISLTFPLRISANMTIITNLHKFTTKYLKGITGGNIAQGWKVLEVNCSLIKTLKCSFFGAFIHTWISPSQHPEAFPTSFYVNYYFLATYWQWDFED